MSLVASSDEETGHAHATILASKSTDHPGRVTYWNHLLEARRTHPLAYDREFSDWIWEHLEAVDARLGAQEVVTSSASPPQPQ